MFMETVKDPHEDQWKKLFELYTQKSTSEGDIYDRRAEACRTLLDKYC